MGRLKALPSLLTILPPTLRSFDKGDAGRAQASPWRAWYNTAAWKALRMRVLRRDRFTCQRPECGHIEPDTSLLVADHKLPHRGDERLFWDDTNLWTLCKPCHDGWKQRAEQDAMRSGRGL